MSSFISLCLVLCADHVISSVFSEGLILLGPGKWKRISTHQCKASCVSKRADSDHLLQLLLVFKTWQVSKTWNGVARFKRRLGSQSQLIDSACSLEHRGTQKVLGLLKIGCALGGEYREIFMCRALLACQQSDKTCWIYLSARTKYLLTIFVP